MVQAEASEARKTAVSPTSSGRPLREIGCIWRRCSRVASRSGSWLAISRASSVSMKLGQIVFARIPFGGEIQGDGSDHADHAGLGRAISDTLILADDAIHRGYGDDGAAAVLDHMRCGIAAGEEGGEKIRLGDPLEIG